MLTKPLKILLVLVVIAVVIIALGVGLGLGLQSNSEEETYTAAVVTNGIECSKIASDILKLNGTVADAAVAALFCEGVTCPQSMGLGGGFLLTIYIKETGITRSLNARETAPKASFKDMFENATTVTGPLSVAVPGDLKGYWELHKQYGKLDWASLIQPTIDLCKKGHIVTTYLGSVLATRKEFVLSNPQFKKVFFNPETNDVYKIGSILKRPDLAETLEIIAKEGVDTMYKNGTIAKRLIGELQSLGGILTMNDLNDYEVHWQEPEVAKLYNNFTVNSTPLPGSGALLTFILNILNGYLPDHANTLSYQRIIESFKYAFGSRTHLADPDFDPVVLETVNKLRDPSYALEIRSKIKDNETYQDYKHYGGQYSIVEDHGTAHISILAANGDAVSATGTINTILGSKVLSASTGLILNDEMDDFSNPGIDNAYEIPSSPLNYIVPGKRPLSSMCPAIITDVNGNVRLVIGAAGGSKITTSIAYVIARHLWFNEPIDVAVVSKRFHHQLMPMHIEHEIGVDASTLKELSSFGHVLKELPPEDGFAAITAIAKIGNKISAAYDKRRSGSIIIF